MGEIPTECLYFAVGFKGFEAGVMITASHNPKEYNGFKMIKKSDNGFSMIRGKDLIDAVSKEDSLEIKSKGIVKNIDVIQDYLNHIFSLVDVKSCG